MTWASEDLARADRLRVLDFFLAGLSGLLLALPYNYPQLFLLSWFAFVPLLFALRDKRPGQGYLLGLTTGLVLYLAGAWWIVEFITRLKGYDLPLTLALSVLFWLYSAQLPALLSLLFVWLRRHSGVPALVLFPVLVAVFFALFPMLFHAQLGESQSAFLVALQGVAFTGVYGLDAVIALANLVLFQLLCGNSLRGERGGLTAAVAVVALWLGFGFFSLSTWDERTNGWETRKLGFVQHSTGPQLTAEPPTPGYSRSYPRAMELTASLADAGAGLVVWPETRFIRYFEQPQVRRAFQHQVAQMAVPLLLQDMERENSRETRREYNTALLLNDRGEEQDRYRKIKRVAFGEYLPLLGDYPGIKAWAGRVFEGFFSEVAPGAGPRAFKVAGLNLVPLICYESMFPDFVAAATAAGETGQVLAVLSNNAWFGATRQPYQHLYASVLRAVENRVPLVHVINNGPSGVVLPSGRLLFQAPFGEEAGYLVALPYSADAGGSFFTRHPHLFSGTLYGLTATFVLMALVRRWRAGIQASPAHSL